MTETETTTPPETGTAKTTLEKAAGIISALSSPFLVPTIGFISLFYGTYLRILPAPYKWFVLSIVSCFTFFAPLTIIYLFQKINGWGVKELGERKKRFIPYLLTMASYVACSITMSHMHMPRYMSGIITAALLCMIVCTLVNFRWKISTHVAGIGMLTGGFISYSMLLGTNPIYILCILILWAGTLGTARIIVKLHTLFEVLAGFVTGFLCGIIGILFI